MKEYLRKRLAIRDKQLRYDFLPSMLEIIERPANKAAGLIIWLIALTLVSAVIWAYFFKLDIVVTATGVIVPEDNLFALQSEYSGRVSEISVKESDRVEQDAPILCINQTDNERNIEDLRYDLEVLRVQKEIYEKLYEDFDNEEPEEIERAASESVAELSVYDVANNGIGRGSGFAAFSDRLLITNDHVLEKADHLKVKTEAGDIFSLKAEDILIRDEDADLAICLLPEDCTLKALPVAEDIPLRGESAVAIGSARGILNLVTIGNVSGHWSDAVVDWLLFSTPVSPGSSGGPLINDDGEVIGVVMGSYDDSQNLNFAVPIQEAGRLIGQLPEEY